MGKLSAQQDTIKHEDGFFVVDTTSNSTGIDSSNYRNPKTAMYLSMAMPGLGQIYNRKYWKLAIIYPIMGGSGYFFYQKNAIYQKYMRALVLMQDSIIEDYKGYNYSQIYKKKDQERRLRDLTAFAIIAFWAINVVDAYVDAHFSTFDISNNLSLQLSPTILNNRNSLYATNTTFGLKIELNF